MVVLIAALAFHAAPGLLPVAQVEEKGFNSLFDGTSLAGWKGYKQPKAPASWSVVNGELISTPGPNGGDLSTVKEYGDFDIRLEWNTEKGGNSGVIYRSGDDYEASWQTGPEYQLLDDFQGDPKGRADLHSAGALYDLYVPSQFVTKKPGEWNETRIVCQGSHIQHYLNGVKIVDCTVGSADWNARVEKSKFKAFPLFAKKRRGYILLQDHGHAFRFRRIRIREL